MSDFQSLFEGLTSGPKSNPAADMMSRYTPIGLNKPTPEQLESFKKPLKPSTPPVSAVTKKPVSAFASAIKPQEADTSLGSYKGIPIHAGGDVAAQMAAIDRGTPTLTSTGSIVSADHQGNITSPSSFRIDTSGTVPSNLLGSTLSTSDVMNTRKSYADYVNGLSQAQRYSPEYIDALNAANAVKTRGAELTSNFYTGNNLPGDTLGYAQGFTTREQALNDIRSLSANQALQVQELVRQGNIAGAKALVDAYAPQSISPGSSLISPVTGDAVYGGAGAYSDYQAQQTYFNFMQNFSDAQIPEYNPNLTPQQNLQIAQQLVSTAPSFQSRNLMQVTDSAGGIHFVNKNQLQTNKDGSYTYIPSNEAAGLSADKSSLATQQAYADTVQRSINTADANFTLLANLMKETGINDAGSPILNQLNNKFNRGVIGDGDISSFNAILTSIRAEYAQVIARGGAVTDATQAEANQLIPNDISLSQLLKVKAAIEAEGANVIREAQNQVQTINSRLGGTNGSGGLYDF